MTQPLAPRRRAGFTLIDLLITVTILAILAAIVVPRFTHASDPALISRTLTELHTVRGQLELYRLHHGGSYPALDGMWTALTQRTDASGAPVASGGFGPYLQKSPTNPYTQSSTVVAPGAQTAAAGWTYNAATGAFYAVGFDEVAKTFTSPGDSGSSGSGDSKQGSSGKGHNGNAKGNNGSNGKGPGGNGPPGQN